MLNSKLTPTTIHNRHYYANANSVGKKAEQAFFDDNLWWDNLILSKGETVISKDHWWLAATTDYVANEIDGKRAIEIKSFTSPAQRKRAKKDGSEAKISLLTAMWVLGLSKGSLVLCDVDGENFKNWERLDLLEKDIGKYIAFDQLEKKYANFFLEHIEGVFCIKLTPEDKKKILAVLQR